MLKCDIRTIASLLIVLIIAISGVCPYKLSGQCSQSSRIITDLDTTDIKILISGADNNDLASPDQGVCGLRIRFNHSFVGDLTMQLISPAGQTVTLIGPVVNFGFTFFTVWDVYFTRCMNPASPDAGYSPTWSNAQFWGIFGNYNGTYYPQMGCLEDFDTGSVNGTWTLRSIDNLPFQSGRLQLFEIYFCDDQGINCNVCNLPSVSISKQDDAYCRGSDMLNFDLNIEYSDSIAVDTYRTATLYFFDGQLLEIDRPNNDFRMSIPGEYKICPLVYALSDSIYLPSLGIDFQEAQDLLASSSKCITPLDTCFTFYIYDRADTIRINQQFCGDFEYKFRDSVFVEPGNYEIILPGEFCDTIVFIELAKFDANLSLDHSSRELDCINRMVEISATFNPLIENPTFVWKLNYKDTLSSSVGVISVSEPGKYTLIMEADNCVDSVSMDIVQNFSVPVVNLEVAQELNCIHDSAYIRYDIIGDYTGVSWSSSSAYTIVSDGIKTVNPNWYYITVSNGLSECSTVDSVEILSKVTLLQFTIDAENLSCYQAGSQISFIGEKDSIHSFSWIRGNVSDTESIEPMALDSGLYILEVTNIEFCKSYDTLKIERNEYSLAISAFDTTLTCDKTSLLIDPMVLGGIGDISYSWSGVGITDPSDSLQVLSLPGNYELVVSDSNGCTGLSNFELIIDTIPPNISLSDQFLDCESGSTNLSIVEFGSNYQYHWQGPGWSSSEKEPTVTQVGAYYVTVTGENGCFTIDSLMVFDSQDFPKPQFEVSNIDCTLNVATITPQNTENYNFLWSGSGLISNPSDAFAVINTAGSYSVTVVDTLSSCSSFFQFQIEDHRVYAGLTLTSDTLNCAKTEIQIILNADQAAADVLWSEPISGFVSTDLSPKVDVAGKYYVEYKTVDGCITVDSVEIIADYRLPEYSIFVDTLDCLNTKQTIVFSPISDIVDVSYLSPSGILIYDFTPEISDTGLYIITVTGKNNCSLSDSFWVVGNFDQPIITLQSDTIYLPCEKDLLQLQLGSNVELTSVLWQSEDFVSSDREPLISVPGWYKVTATGLNGCEVTDSLLVLRDDRLPKLTVEKTDITCDGNPGNISIVNKEDGVQYFWRFPDFTVTQDDDIIAPITGVYTLFGISGNNCIDSLEIVIDSIFDIPDFTIIQLDTFQCENKNIRLTLLPFSEFPESLTYTWATDVGDILMGRNTGTVLVRGEGTYSLTVRNPVTTCESTVEYDLVESEQELASFNTSVTAPLCFGIPDGIIEIIEIIGGYPPYLFEIDGLPFQDNRTVSGLNAGNYTIMTIDSLGCVLSKIITIPEGQSPMVTILGETIGKKDSEFSLRYLLNLAQSEISNLFWINDESSCTNCEEFKFYATHDQWVIIQIETKNGCIARDSVWITIADDKIILPNAFRPGSAGENSKYYIPAQSTISEIELIEIYDRWGNVVFLNKNISPGDPAQGWDGTYGNKELENGIYVMLVRLRLKDSASPIIMIQDILLIR